MKAQLTAHFQQWHEDNPTEELKPGYQEIDVDKWQVKEVMDKQPQWRFQFLARWRTIQEYKEAPRSLRIDPSFCPVPRRYTWEQFEVLLKDNPNALNYPLCPVRPHDQPLNETWFLEACADVEAKFTNAMDLSCQMLVKIVQLLSTCITVFQDIQHQRTD